MRNLLPSRRGFHKSERRVFCPCELCRLRFGRMLFSRDGGPPLRSYRRLRRPTIAAMRAARRGELVTVGPEGLLASLNKDDPRFVAEARRQGRLVSASYKDDEDIAFWLGPE